MENSLNSERKLSFLCTFAALSYAFSSGDTVSSTPSHTEPAVLVEHRPSSAGICEAAGVQ